MNRKRGLWVWVSLLVIAQIIGLYFMFVRNLVELEYAGNSPSWFHSLVEFLYPRFSVEKERFTLDFFLSKADQIIFRFALVSFFLTALWYTIQSETGIKNQWQSFWNRTYPAGNIFILRILFYLLMIVIFKDIYWDLLNWGKAEVFYRPILLYKIFHLSFASSTEILFIYIVLIGSCMACIFNFYPVLFSIIALTDFILIQGYIFGFEKTDHGFAPFTYAGMVMPFLLYYQQQSQKSAKPLQEGWPLQLILTLLALCYLFSGLEKVLISKMAWIHPSTFRAYLTLHETALGMKVAKSDFLCTLLPILTLLFQLGFILVLFFKKLRWVFIPAAVVFHISTYLLFNVGGFTNPWILVLIFFINWNPLYKKIFLKKS